MKKVMLALMLAFTLLSNVSAATIRFEFDDDSKYYLNDTHCESSSLVLNESALQGDLVSHYTLDDGGTDEEWRNNGTAENVFFQDSTARFGGSGEFWSGNSSYIDIGTGWSGLTNCSFSWWFNVADISDYRAMLGIGDASDNRWFVNVVSASDSYHPNEVQIYYNTGGVSERVYSGQQVSTGVWYHVVVTINTVSGTTLYLNAAPSSNSEMTKTWADVNADARIGQAFYLSDWQFSFEGYLDNFMIFNKTLSSTEVEYLYNAGEGVEFVKYANEGYANTQMTEIAHLQRFITFSSSSNVMSGTDVQYYYRIDKNDPWTLITPGTSWETISTAGQQIQFRVTENSTGRYTPYVNYIEIEYQDYEPVPPAVKITRAGYWTGVLDVVAMVSQGNDVDLSDYEYTLYVDDVRITNNATAHTTYVEFNTSTILDDGLHDIAVEYKVKKKYDDDYYTVKDSVLIDTINNFTAEGSTSENILLNTFDLFKDQLRAQYFYNTMLLIILIVLILKQGEKK